MRVLTGMKRRGCFFQVVWPIYQLVVLVFCSYCIPIATVNHIVKSKIKTFLRKERVEPMLGYFFRF